jgi:acetyl-CoA carboxylase biotin carboxyl carrier protein
MAENDIDIKKIKELIEIMKQNGLEELEIKHDDDKIYLKRSQPYLPQASAVVPVQVAQQQVGPAPVGSPEAGGLDQAGAIQQEGILEIKSPIVGTFYAKPSPDSEPYVEIGSTVNSQTIICIIEAMKVMNEIKAEFSGTIVESLVTDGQAVEYGQVLFKVRPD